MEYVKGKELFDYIVMKKKLSESESCLFFQQLISGIEYLHKIKYVHRDIKPENLLINEETKELKIVDFGLSNIYTNPNKHLLSSACGSPSYAAPEMLNGEKYRAPPVDIWSSGIVLYAMICGYLPFEDDDNDILYDKICKGKFVIPNHVSEKARDLLNQILVTDPKKRLTIYQIKNHPWFSLYNNKGKLMISDGLILTKYVVPIDEEVVSSMSKTFSVTEEKIRISILSNKHDDLSTIYYLLLNKKINNKKKSVADIKSDLFKKYCENKNNLFDNYDKDINKVLEDRKNGYLYNLQNLSQSKVLSSSVIDIKKLNKNEKINSNNSSTKKNNENKKTEKKSKFAKTSRYLSPDHKEKKINIIHTNRESIKTQKTNEKPKISKFNTKNTTFNPKNNINTKDKKDLASTNRNKKENQEKTNTKKEENKNMKNSIIKEKVEEENNEKRNLIKHREKKVHYTKKVDKNINLSKKVYNIKTPNTNIKDKNNLKNSIKGLTNIKNDVNKNRIKSAFVENTTNKKKNIKEKNELNTLKKSINFDTANNSNIKGKKNIKTKNSLIDEIENKKDKKDVKDKNDKIDKIDKIAKLNRYKTPEKELNDKNINIKSKLNKPFDKNKTFELSERGQKRKNTFNRTVDMPKPHREILLSEDSKKIKQKLNMKIIYEKQELNNSNNKNIQANSHKNDEKKKLISFHTNNNISQDIYNKLLDNSKIKQIKPFPSYNVKKPNNKLIKFIHKNSDKILDDKYILVKQKVMPNLEIEKKENRKESFSKIDEDSILISNKNLNCYEPFDLSLAYIKPRKELKEELINLFEKNKIKYKNISNTRYMIEFKKEEETIEIKFDKLNYINDENEVKENNIRISIIKLRKIKGNYQNHNKEFEKIIYKLK